VRLRHVEIGAEGGGDVPELDVMAKHVHASSGLLPGWCPGASARRLGQFCLDSNSRDLIPALVMRNYQCQKKLALAASDCSVF